jgi:hypothetical protein
MISKKLMGNGRESLMTVTNYNTPVKDLTYKDLLTITFTQTSPDRVSHLEDLGSCFFQKDIFAFEKICRVG